MQLYMYQVERVHDECAVEHAREARELGEDGHAGGDAAERARDHVFERVGVDGLAHRRVDDNLQIDRCMRVRVRVDPRSF